jgi:rSAM/selenodomain-associated transferase 1
LNTANVDKLVENVDKQAFLRPFKNPAPVLAVFAKQPVAGQVKTRLCPPLTEIEAARLCQVALAETVQRLWDCPARMVLFYAGERAWFDRAFPEVLLAPQTDGPFGERLQAAAAQLFAAGAGPVLMIGSDSPDLPETLIPAALTELEQADVVTVPCVDGGYALLGMNRPCPELFENIPWSTGHVLEATRAQAARCGLVYCELAEWDDLDDLAALQRLVERSPETGTARYVHGQLSRYLSP